MTCKTQHSLDCSTCRANHVLNVQPLNLGCLGAKQLVGNINGVDQVVNVSIGVKPDMKNMVCDVADVNLMRMII